jgi:hypothetical protein
MTAADHAQLMAGLGLSGTGGDDWRTTTPSVGRTVAERPAADHAAAAGNTHSSRWSRMNRHMAPLARCANTQSLPFYEAVPPNQVPPQQ